MDNLYDHHFDPRILDGWTFTTEEVAEILKLTKDHFIKKREKLEKEHGFPTRLAGFKGLYSGFALRAWLISNGKAQSERNRQWRKATGDEPPVNPTDEEILEFLSMEAAE